MIIKPRNFKQKYNIYTTPKPHFSLFLSPSLSKMEGFLGIDDTVFPSDKELGILFRVLNKENNDNIDVIMKPEVPDTLDPEVPGGEGKLPEADILAVPKPLEGLYGQGPSPFLKKMLTMVNDPETDAIISWSDSELSFVIWDIHKFTTDIIPKYFKHSNLCSFVRQLNTYGFKKIDADRWEYANEDFQKGKYHLLKNIKRRRCQSDCQVGHNQKKSQISLHSEKLEKEAELNKLKKDQDELWREILKIQEKQHSANNHLLYLKDRLRNAEHKQQHLLMFMSKAVKEPLFIEIMEQLMPKKLLDGNGSSKTRKLISPDCKKRPIEETKNSERCQVEEKCASFEPDIRTLFSPDESRIYVVQDKKVNKISATNKLDVAPEKLWEKLVDEDVVLETKAATEQANRQSKIVLELEELMTQLSTDWDVCVDEIMERGTCVPSQS